MQAGITKYENDAEDNRTAVIKNAGTKEEVRTEYVVDFVEELSRVLMAVEKTTGNIASGNAYVEGNTVSYLNPFGLEPLLTEELHDFASIASAVGSGVSFFHPAAGYYIGEVAFFFDTGVYINDIFTSGFDGDVIKKALSSTVSNGKLFTVGTMAYLDKLGNVSKNIGDICSIITIGVTKTNLEQKIVKKIIEKVKEYIDKKIKGKRRHGCVKNYG